MTFGALILAAGHTAQRESFDPLQKIGSLSAVQRLIMTFHLAEVRPVVVVVSKEDEAQLQKHALRAGVEFVQGLPAQAEMFANVKLGLGVLAHRCDRVLITPVDIPLFSVDTVKMLMRSGQPLACPVCEGRKGHPLLIAREVIPAILQYRGNDGLRGAVRACGIAQTLVEVADPGVYVHSNQFDQCEKIATSHNRQQWRPLMKLQIARESAFLGPGSWQLLSLIETSGSVRMASAEMGISYSKAWKILNNMESQLGYHVLHRQPGGKHGGETHLTQQGKLLLEQFERFERECSAAVNRIFAKYYGEQ